MDPIDPKRNLGAAISVENFGKFVLAARTFLNKPSIEFFIRQERVRTTNDFSEIYSNILVVSFNYRERSPDVIWGQLKKSMNAISKQLTLGGFNVIRSICTTDERIEAVFIFLLESITLPSYMVKTGPKVSRKHDSSKFISKNNNVARLIWIDNEMRITTLVARKATDAREYVRLLLDERIDSIGITKGLVSDLGNKTQIYTANENKITYLVKTAIDELTTIEKIFF